MDLHGQTVLITGASSGIGAAMAKRFSDMGARVVLLARTQKRLEEVAVGIRANGGEAHVYPIDLSDLPRVTILCGEIEEEMGAPDIIVNNAGAGRYLSLEETTPAEAMQMMHVPYFAAFTLTHAFLPAMLARNSGHIVNVTSPAAYVSFPGAAAYSIARWAMRGFAETLWAELYGTAIGCTLMVAGKTSSDYFANNPGSEERLPKISKIFPLLTSEQVAEAILRAVTRNRSFVVIPFRMRLVLMVHQLFPGIIRSLAYRTGWKRETRASP